MKLALLCTAVTLGHLRTWLKKLGHACEEGEDVLAIDVPNELPALVQCTAVYRSRETYYCSIDRECSHDGSMCVLHTVNRRDVMACVAHSCTVCA